MKTTSRILLSVLLIFVLPLFAGAENRSVVKPYQFLANGTLKVPLTVAFTTGAEIPIIATTQASATNKKTLALEIHQGQDIFSLTMSKSWNYTLYKEKTRNAEHEELIIFGYDKLAPNRYQLEEIVIIGVDNKGKLTSFKINDFEQLELIRAPLQITDKGELILALSAYRSGKTILRIDWQEKSFSYKCSIK